MASTNAFKFPNTNTTIETGGNAKTSSGLSTQIIIKVNNIPCGAIQSLSVNQSRGLTRIKEIGTDGTVEIVPTAATEFTIDVSRIVFDQLRLPEAFQRDFRFINAQRLPFDIEIYDVSNAATVGSTDANGAGVVVMKYVGCWFTTYNTPYQADNYLITEQGTIWAESGYVAAGLQNGPIARNAGDAFQTNTVEQQTNSGLRRGSLDVSGIVNSVFGGA